MMMGWKGGITILLCCLLIAPMVATAAPDDGSELPPPMTYEQLRKTKPITKPDAKETAMPFDIRRDAMKESALSYGARGGLAWRTYNIRQEMETRSRYLDKVFDFRQLLIPAPSGLLIEPPIISEAVNAMLIETGGQQAAVADRVYNIGRSARIVSAPRTWRAYLERQWGDVATPPDILMPQTGLEWDDWYKWLEIGWQAGVEQADEIFQADLNKLSGDYNGMVRYRTLLAQGMVSPPYALQTDRGVTGNGREMRVGDRNVVIANPAELKPGTDAWQPANR